MAEITGIGVRGGLDTSHAAGSNDPESFDLDYRFDWHYHRAVEGETLDMIAEKNHLDAEEKAALRKANPALDPTKPIPPGYLVAVPSQRIGRPF